MFDLYTVIVPIFGLIALATLITLKLAIKDNVTLSKVRQNSQLESQLKVEN